MPTAHVNTQQIRRRAFAGSRPLMYNVNHLHEGLEVRLG